MTVEVDLLIFGVAVVAALLILIAKGQRHMSQAADQIVADVAALKSAISKLGTDLGAVEAQLAALLAAPSVDAAALAQAHTDLQTIIGQVNALDASTQPAAPAPAP